MGEELFNFDVKAPEYVLFKPTKRIFPSEMNYENINYQNYLPSAPLFKFDDNFNGIETVDYSDDNIPEIKAQSKKLLKFINQLNSALSYTPQYNTNKWKLWFIKLADAESDFIEENLNTSTGAYGYFQLMPYNRISNNQFNDMFNLMTLNLRQLKSLMKDKEIKRAEELGVNLLGLLAGAHLGGVGGVLKVLRLEGNPRDINGTSVLQYMKEFSI